MNTELRTLIIEALDIGAFPSKNQDEIISGMSQNILTRIGLRAASLLDDNDRGALEEIMEKGDDKEILKFLESKIEGFGALIETEAREEIEAFKKEAGTK